MLAAWSFSLSRVKAASSFVSCPETVLFEERNLARLDRHLDLSFFGLELRVCSVPTLQSSESKHSPVSSKQHHSAGLAVYIFSYTTIMFRRPGTSRSKASSDTLCQKCLKRGHYSYECKATAQERPYQSRPSRTQQLLNPKLKPKLTTEVPEDLSRKKGVADEILKKKEEERLGRDRKRSRSFSASSVDSVPTISTNRSPSRSRSPPPRRTHNESSLRGRDDKVLSKRRRRSPSKGSRSPEGSERMETSHEDMRQNELHGRDRSRQRHGKQPVRRPSLPRSKSRSLDRMDTSDDHRPRNGASKGRRRASPPARGATSHSLSPYRPGRDRSPSPLPKRQAPQRSPSPRGGRNEHQGRAEAHGSMRNRFDTGSVRNGPSAAPPPPPMQRERSLSPFSKRVALTKAMQAGRM
jgi:hypothetical protein